jgi:hypothetical protein
MKGVDVPAPAGGFDDANTRRPVGCDQLAAK